MSVCLRIRKLIESMQRKWEEISMNLLEVLLSPMPCGMNVGICAKGGSTRW